MQSFQTFTEATFNTIADPDVPERTRLARSNRALADLGTKYHDGVPIDEIFGILNKNGFVPIDETGAPWTGIILGRDATYHFELKDIQTGIVSKRGLHMSHHKMDVSGRYEVTAYVN